MVKKSAVICVIFTLIFSSCASSNAASTDTSAKEPDWIRNPYTKYDRQTNAAAVGNGNSRETAEKDALGKLAALFGQSIQVDEKVSTSYRDAVRNGVIANWSENTASDINIVTSASLDSLVGAEIGEVWDDGRGNNYAVAVLNKARAIQVYSGMIKSYQEMIEKLITMNQGEKNSLEGFSRYQLAASLADINTSYGNVLSVLGAAAPVGLKNGADYRLEAQNIARAIPVGLAVINDKSERIQGAFAKALSDLGFISGGINPRYMLDVVINTSPVEFPNNTNIFIRIELSANFTDANSGTVLLPYNFNNREGHITQEQAENRVYTTAELKINEEYKNILSDYLSRLLQKK